MTLVQVSALVSAYIARTSPLVAAAQQDPDGPESKELFVRPLFVSA